MFDKDYDIIVIGGGPAGLTAARYSAKGGASTVLFEKDRDIGYPLRCAEGIGEKGLTRFIEPSQPWKGQKINYAVFISPSGKAIKVDIGIKGYVIHRKLFDYEISRIASQNGAKVFTKCYVRGLIKIDNKIKGVIVRHLNKEYRIRCKVIIGADGIESRTGRWAGIDTSLRLNDVITCAQVTATRIDIDEKSCQFYFGKEIAPGGYAWIFPKGKGLANIGLGISGKYSSDRSPVNYLRKFLDKNFPKCSFQTIVAGGVPSSGTLKDIVKDNVLLVGDAAHQVNPLSGGGIAYAMAAGKLAGTIAAEAIHNSENTEKYLQKYQKEWNKEFGKEIKSYYKIKEALLKFEDDDFEKIAEIISEIKPEELSLRKIFLETFKAHPKILFHIMKVIK